MQLDTPLGARQLAGHYARPASGEYVVYHFLAKSLVRCTPEGEMLNGHNEMGYVFETPAAAQEYCPWKVNENSKSGCTVYDSDGKVADQIFSNQYLAKANAPAIRSGNSSGARCCSRVVAHSFGSTRSTIGCFLLGSWLESGWHSAALHNCC
jgi:hypothetical protein